MEGLVNVSVRIFQLVDANFTGEELRECVFVLVCPSVQLCLILSSCRCPPVINEMWPSLTGANGKEMEKKTTFRRTVLNNHCCNNELLMVPGWSEGIILKVEENKYGRTETH